MSRYINVYEVYRHYGGPEEGGWYWDSGELLISVQVTGKMEGEAEAAELLLKDYLERSYPDDGSRFSVLGGTDYQVRIEDHDGKSWPEERPHYE